MELSIQRVQAAGMIWRVVSRETSVTLYDLDDNQAPPGTLAARYG